MPISWLDRIFYFIAKKNPSQGVFSRRPQSKVTRQPILLMSCLQTPPIYRANRSSSSHHDQCSHPPRTVAGPDIPRRSTVASSMLRTVPRPASWRTLTLPVSMSCAPETGTTAAKYSTGDASGMRYARRVSCGNWVFYPHP